MARFQQIAVRSRSGSKIHGADNGGSGTNCGVWLKGHATHFQVEGKVSHRHLCEKCFGYRPSADLLAEMGIEVTDMPGALPVGEG